MKKIAIIGIVGVPANYGGFETLVDNLLNTSNKDIEYTVYCSSSAYTNKILRYKGAVLKYLPLKANGYQSILYDMISIFLALRNHDCLLILGVSGCLILPVVKYFTKVKIIVNIDGLEHKRDKWGKFIRKYLKWSEKLAIKYADIIVSDNKGIQNYVYSEYGVKSELIAYGGDHVYLPSTTEQEDYFLALCRIEPENNVHTILKAFENIDEKLIFIGNWSRSQYGNDLKSMYSDFSNIQLLEPIYDIKKLGEYRRKCKCYIHGHSAGGTNPSLVEMMFFNRPIIAFDVIYNRESTENKALYFKDSNHLEIILNDICKYETNQIAFDMFEIANRRYTWEIITKQYENLYI